MEEPNMSNKTQVPPLPEAQCKRFFRDLLLGLEYRRYCFSIASPDRLSFRKNWAEIKMLINFNNFRKLHPT